MAVCNDILERTTTNRWLCEVIIYGQATLSFVGRSATHFGGERKHLALGNFNMFPAEEMRIE